MAGVRGDVRPGHEAVTGAFGRFLAERREAGAASAVSASAVSASAAREYARRAG